MQEWGQGWSFSPGINICHHCLGDVDLARHVKDRAEFYDCGFCRRVSRQRPMSIAFDGLMGIVGSTLEQYYDRAANELSYCSAEGGYIGRTYEAYDLVYGRSPFCEITENTRVLEAIYRALGSEFWCDKSPHSTIGLKAHQLSWDHFCKAVKHRSRYFFTQRNSGDENSDLTPVSMILEELSSHFEREKLIEDIPQGTDFTRIRVHQPGERCEDWRSLGSPPAVIAPSNRMSPAGISMFYCSKDLLTARSEALSTLPDGKPAALTAATWRTSRPILVLNLCDIRATPSVWFSKRSVRDRVLFLQAFAKDISQPVVHDGREHIEYVPSQIVTEYFRRVYNTADGEQLDGIMYPSSRFSKGRNLVIFASPDDLDPVCESLYRKTPVLALASSTVKRLRIRKSP